MLKSPSPKQDSSGTSLWVIILLSAFLGYLLCIRDEERYELFFVLWAEFLTNSIAVPICTVVIVLLMTETRRLLRACCAAAIGCVLLGAWVGGRDAAATCANAFACVWGAIAIQHAVHAVDIQLQVLGVRPIHTSIAGWLGVIAFASILIAVSVKSEVLIADVIGVEPKSSVIPLYSGTAAALSVCIHARRRAQDLICTVALVIGSIIPLLVVERYPTVLYEAVLMGVTCCVVRIVVRHALVKQS